MKVLVCDDEATRYEDVVSALQESGDDSIEIVPLIASDLTEQLERLFDRVESCLDRSQTYAPSGDLKFDEADLAIFDNNLSNLDIKGTRLTGESVVGYVRCFSRAPYVVSLNKNPDVDFDLRYLVGDYETRADIALNTEHLSNKRLWNGKAADVQTTFRPWYWPALHVAPDRRRRQIEFIRQRLNESVLSAFGFPTDNESLGFLSLHAKGALSPDAIAGGVDDGKPLIEVTFRDVFMASSRSLPAKEEREKLGEASMAGNGVIDELLARVVAADIDRWFRRDVLGPQEMLVDVAHLLLRMPFLLGEASGDITAWNHAIQVDDAPFGMQKALFEQHLSKALFTHRMWVPTPAFWWPTLKRNDELGALFFADANPKWSNAFFCEDISAFVEPSDDSSEINPVEFSAEFEGSWSRRHVAKLEGIRYAPRSRFAV